VDIIQSFSHRLLLGPAVSDLAVATAEVLVLMVVFDRKANRLVAFIAFAAAVASDFAHYVLSPSSYAETPLPLIHHGALLLLLSYATIVILRNIFEQRVVRSDDVLGAVCGYLLAAAAWSNLFSITEILVPGSFSVGQGFGLGIDRWLGRIAVLNYVSLGSLTSVGSGSVVPVLPPATALVPLEAVFGQFYIAIVVAQLVGARLSRALLQDNPPAT
jgi:hypothetical protein